MNEFIPVSSPALIGNEKAYVLDCLESTWISSLGKYINQFEEKFADFCKTRYALSCINGTAALHLALLALDIGPGDEVIVPTLTYIASANAIKYCGATPVFIDSSPDCWNLDDTLLEKLITERTKAILVVHLYGHPANMGTILSIAEKHNLYVIEDAAEAHGGMYKDNIVGSMGHISTFSFYGNKIITSGEGGMVCTNDETLALKVRQLKGQGQDFVRRYWFPIVGYNYRMTNIQAAIGLAQLEKIGWHIDRKREIASWYQDYLRDLSDIHSSPELPWAKSVYWLFSVLLNTDKSGRDLVMEKMRMNGIETRPFFYPIHTLPPYVKSPKRVFPVAERLARTGINLPSSALLKKTQVKYVVDTLVQALEK